MYNNILPSCDKTIYETHFWIRKRYPFIFHRDKLNTDGKQYTPGLHVNIEILHILEGHGQVILNGVRKDVLPGDIVIINSYIAHTIITSETIKSDCLIIDHHFLAENGLDLSQLEFDPLIHDPAVSNLYNQFSEEYYNPRPFHLAILRSAILNLMLYLCQNYSSVKQSNEILSGIMERIWTAVEFMKENLDKKLTLDRIAEKTGLSKYYFLRLFKTYTGYTINTYLTLLRCDRAMQLLKSGDYTVGEVSELCGFDNRSYFSKIFKQHTGQLPSDIIKES